MEAKSVAASQHPVTVSSLVADLRHLGLTTGCTVIVHTAMSRLGWVAGGAQAVIEALLDIVAEDGTLVMPTHSTQLSEPSYWQNPPVPPQWWRTLRAETPPFDRAVTPSRHVGAVPECFRRWPGTRRSNHPTLSFTARGPNAAEVVAQHPLEDGLGERSPLGRLYRLDALVLLLGVDHGVNTSLHLAEYRARFDKPMINQGSPMSIEGDRRWVTYRDLDGNSDDFAALGEDFARETGAEHRGPVGSGTGRLLRQRAAVDYAVEWLERHRPGGARRQE